MSIDHATKALELVDKADQWANRDNIRDPELRAHMIDYNLRLAQIHATLAVAQQVSALPLPE